MVKLIKAKEKDLTLIADLAKIIWNEHYVAIIGQQQVDYMLDKIYNLESLKDQVHVKKHQFYLIESNQNNIGFVSISSENNQDFFIHKFYVLTQQSNRGIGSRVLDLIVAMFSPKSLSLTVNRQNYKSINFYFKNGFKIERVADFDIGNGFVMNDFVMAKSF